MFKGVRQKFIDALLGAAKIEHIMPKVGRGGGARGGVNRAFRAWAGLW
jgi:hypothetical protein